MPSPISNIPILLFPLKLETRFVADELWIRAFPDEAFVQSHNPTLNQEERKDARAFKAHTTKAQKEPAWEALVAKYGIYRASWIVQIGNDELNRQENENGTAEEEPSFFFKWLPDRLVFHLYKTGDQNPSYKGDGSVIDREGLVVLGEGDEWLQDFDLAIAVGMGIKMKIDPSDTSFEKIIVSGFRHDSDPEIPAQGLSHLFDNHRYTEGFSFLSYDTPTNNTETGVSGHSAKQEFEVGDSYDYAVEGLNLPDHSFGAYLAFVLGFDIEKFKHFDRADGTPTMMNEIYQKATWFALGAQHLFMLLGDHMDANAHGELWRHYSKYVKHRGPAASLKIGKQPYGILPVMNISHVFRPEHKAVLESTAFFDQLMVVLAHLHKRWLTMGKEVPRLTEESSYEEVLRILSMQEASSSYQIRALQYPFLKDKLYRALQKAPESDGILKLLETLGQDYDLLGENIASLSQLFRTTESNTLKPIDQLLRTPLLGLTAVDSRFIGFHGNRSQMMDEEGNVMTEKTTTESDFSFAQEDLSNFQDFITALQEQKENELVQYKGDLSLFTDLFIRSYTNAYQLYNRSIVWNPLISQLGSSNTNITGFTVVQPEGSSITTGDTVIELQWSNTKTRKITAPFDGKVKKILLSEEQLPNLAPGTPIFSLVDETKYQEIRQIFIEMGTQLIEANHALSETKDRRAAQTKAIGEAIDLNSYRLDAWITALATRRLEEMRTKTDYKKGIYFGAYGWIENLKRNEEQVDPDTLTDLYRENGGIIHTPSAAQTVASTVFKNSFLAHSNEKQGNPFTINLSSDRIQKSQFILDGIRNGQQLEALLGYQLERHLHDNALHGEIYLLREAFPLYENSISNTTGFANLSVIDGLKAMRNKNALPDTISPTAKKQIKPLIERLEDTMDANLDVLFFEAGYQITQGNMSQAAAALGATKGEIVPPPIESLRTKISGTGIGHKLAMVFPQGSTSPPFENIRGFMEPHLEKWLESIVGPMNNILCSVELYEEENDTFLEAISLPLDQLKLGYLDMMYLSQDRVSEGASELELRLQNAAKKLQSTSAKQVKYKISHEKSGTGRTLDQALEMIRHTKSLLDKCRYLKSNDLAMENESVHYDTTGLNDIRNHRLQPLLNRLKEINTSDITQKENLTLLSKLDFESAKIALLTDTSPNVDALKLAIAKKIEMAGQHLANFNTELPFYTAFGYLQEAIKVLMGTSFLVFPPVLASERYKEVLSDGKQQLLVGKSEATSGNKVWGQERIFDWVQGVAQVHENTEIFEDWSMVNTVWEQTLEASEPCEFKIVQAPTLLKYPWIALSHDEIDELIREEYADQAVYKNPISGETYPLSGDDYYPESSEATVIYGPKTIDFEQPVFGLLIEEFTEHIPHKQMDTALGFHYNAPNNEPPQALLLAIHPKAGMDSEFFWSEDDLKDVLSDTIDLFKLRMVDIEAIQEYGYLLPMTYWLNIPNTK